MSLSLFLRQIIASPPLGWTTLLILGVVFVNGWTDAPNAIATCVSTRCMPVRAAVLMAAVCNLLGVLVMTSLGALVAETIYNIADFGGDKNRALIALCAAMTAIVLWAVAAWAFGIPTSESHALIAGVSGAAVALEGFGALHGGEWMKVLLGLVLSAVLGFASGFCVVKAVARLFRNVRLAPAQRFFRAAQIFGGAAMAFMHGAQEILCASTMGLGTCVGGYKIIKSVGMDMVKLEKYEGFSADLAGAFCLFLSTVTGLPVSTTHTKTTAIMGVGAASRVRSVRWSVARDMALAWVLTFPGCSAVGYLTARLFMRLF